MNGDYGVLDIMDAIEARYKGDTNTIAGIYAFLESNLPNNLTMPLSSWFDEHSRCCGCGAKLVIKPRKEYHVEADAYEQMYDAICPNCDGDMA